MARRKQTKGNCIFCSRELSKGGLTRHLKTCSKRQDELSRAGQGKGHNQTIYHLQVQDLWDGDYWLHLEMNGRAALRELDHYLRAIWLECCGHMSALMLGAKGWGDSEIDMSNRAEQVLEPGMTLTHIYDFGTSSETQIKVADVRIGKPLSKHPIFLMARNHPLEDECMECGKPASWLCLECVYELDERGTLCDEHAQDHPHDNYGEPVPLVNSPRVGMCGYTGPADPPY